MRKQLPILVAIALLIFGLSFAVHAQDSDLQTSDYALDLQEGQKDQGPDTLEAQQEVAQDEQADAAADDGDPSTGLVQASLDETLQPEEAQESAKLVENQQATSSENDNGEVLKDQSTQTPQEKPNEDVNSQDDNKAPVTDPNTQPQATQNQEQSMENIQQGETNQGESQ